MPGKCKFNENWTTNVAYKDWIMQDVSQHQAQCPVCQKSFDISNMGEAALKNYGEASSSKNTNDLNTNTATPKSSASVKDMLVLSYLSKEETLIAEIVWMLYTIECHHSFHSNEGVAKIFQVMFPDSETVKKFTCGEKKSAYICSFGLAPYFESILKDKIEKQESFVLFFDESMNIAMKNKQLDVCVRFWDEILDSKFLGHGTSEEERGL
ncbi:Hypothetical predicted protein [Paramuricea clavata]|uniref:Uncharacterized protein n=1 Tax=Paramuricea clavata TaxID=317549 RepID=A0A6S7I2P3_PARCT|nr:Hypothetical predicted protein [Paramuricea clavata]